MQIRLGKLNYNPCWFREHIAMFIEAKHFNLFNLNPHSRKPKIGVEIGKDYKLLQVNAKYKVFTETL